MRQDVPVLLQRFDSLKLQLLGLGVVVTPAFKPSTPESEASVSLRLAWSTQCVPDYSELHNLEQEENYTDRPQHTQS